VRVDGGLQQKDSKSYGPSREGATRCPGTEQRLKKTPPSTQGKKMRGAREMDHIGKREGVAKKEAHVIIKSPQKQNDKINRVHKKKTKRKLRKKKSFPGGKKKKKGGGGGGGQTGSSASVN